MADASKLVSAAVVQTVSENASKLVSAAVVQTASESISKLASAIVLQGTAENVSKLAYAVVLQGSENLSKLVNYAVLTSTSENLSKLVTFAVLTSAPPIALTGRIGTQSETRGTVDIGAAPTLSGRIRVHATGALASPLALAGRASAVGRASGSIGLSIPLPLAGRIRVSLQGHPADVAFGIALGGRITFTSQAHPELRILIPLPPTPSPVPPSRPAFQVYEIPMTAGAPSFRTIRLSGNRVQIAAHWCDPLTSWVLDIADADGNMLINGIPMITGADLLAQYTYINFGGALLAQSDFDWTVPPSFDNLGTVGHLYWIPTGPPALPPPRYPLSPQDPREAQLRTIPPPVPTEPPPNGGGGPPVGTATLFSNSSLATPGPLVGVVDSNVFLCSFWIKDLTDTNNLIITHISGVSGGFGVYLSRVGSLFFAGFQAEDTLNTTNPSVLNAVSSDSSGLGHIDMSVWNHIIIAGNTSFPLGSRIAQIVVNGVPRVVRQSGQGGAFTTDFATRVTAWEFMGVVSSGRFQPGTMYDFWFGPGQYLNTDVAANVQRFRSASGNPVDLGPDGSFPTGLPPAVFCHKDCSDTVAANFANNRGTGGILTTSGNPLSVLSPCPP